MILALDFDLCCSLFILAVDFDDDDDGDDYEEEEKKKKKTKKKKTKKTKKKNMNDDKPCWFHGSSSILRKLPPVSPVRLMS